jgi:hypothetical protein
LFSVLFRGNTIKIIYQEIYTSYLKKYNKLLVPFLVTSLKKKELQSFMPIFFHNLYGQPHTPPTMKKFFICLWLIIIGNAMIAQDPAPGSDQPMSPGEILTPFQDHAKKSTSSLLTFFEEDFSGPYPGAWNIGFYAGSEGSYSWAWPLDYAFCYADPSVANYYYPNNLDVFMERTVDMTDISGVTHLELDFYKVVDTELGYDFFRVNIMDGDQVWHTVYEESGESELEWEAVHLDLSAFNDEPEIIVQFRFTSDGSVCGQSNNEYNGVYIDNIRLSYEMTNYMPDLLPGYHWDWDDAIVVSAEMGTNTESDITEGEIAYIDFAIQNNNDGYSSGPFINYIYIDGQLEHIYDLPDGLAGYYTYHFYEDWQYVFDDPGWHTVTLYIDAEEDVHELSESNNIYERSVYVYPAETPPGQVSNPNPENGAENVSINGELSWSAADGATSYNIYFGTDATPDAGEYVQNQSGRTYYPGELDYNTTYYWRIDAVNNAGTTTGPVWSFTTRTQPYLDASPSQVFLAYQSGSTGSFTINSDCDYWDISWLEPWFSLSTEVGSGTETIIVTANSNNPSSTDVRSRTISIWGEGVGADRYVEIIQEPAPPAAAYNPTPENGETNVSLNPSLSWTGGEGSTEYEIYFGTDPTPDGSEHIGSQSATTYNPGTLDEITTYYWRIDGVNTSGTTTGPVWSFRTLENPYLDLSANEVNLDQYKDSQQDVTINSNDTWEASTMEDWISISPSSGSNNGAITITAVTDNMTRETRTGNVIIEGAGQTEIISVNQDFVIVSVPLNKFDGLGITLYPNPASKRVFMQSSRDINSRILVQLYDATGKLLLSRSLEQMVKNQAVELGIAGFPSGIYLLKLTDREEDIESSERLIIE